MVRIMQASGEECVVHFGQAGASDYTRHKDATRMRRYITRHAGVGVPSRASKDLQRALLCHPEQPRGLVKEWPMHRRVFVALAIVSAPPGRGQTYRE